VHGEPHGERVVEACLALCADTQPQDITILSRHRWWLRMSPKPMQAFRKCDIMTPLGLPARSHELRTSAPFPWSARLQGSPASIAATPRCRPTHLSEATCLLPAGERLYTSRPDLSLVNSCQNERLAKGTHWLAVQENPHRQRMNVAIDPLNYPQGWLLFYSGGGKFNIYLEGFEFAPLLIPHVFK